MKSAAFITGEGFQAENGGGNVFKIFEEYTPLQDTPSILNKITPADHCTTY